MNVIAIGTIELMQPHRFTQYSECAAWTDYVTCQPQVAELRYVDGYWVCAKFDGILTETTFPTGSRTVGDKATAGFQTQAWGGVGNLSDLFKVTITNPAFAIVQVARYDDGRPMMALRRYEAIAA